MTGSPSSEGCSSSTDRARRPAPAFSRAVGVFRRRTTVTLFAALCCAVAAASAHAATFIVNSPMDAVDANPGDGICETAPQNRICTLRAAVMEANRTSGSTIDLRAVPGGVLTLALVATGIDDEGTGDLNIRSNVTIAGAGWSTTIIDAHASYSSLRGRHPASQAARPTRSRSVSPGKRARSRSVSRPRDEREKRTGKDSTTVLSFEYALGFELAKTATTSSGSSSG